MKNKKLCNNILKTLCLFSIFYRPLTKEEIFLYLYSQKPVSQKTIESCLCKLIISKKIIRSDKYYALATDKNIFVKFKKLFLQAQQNWQKAKKIAKLLQLIPFIRSVLIINSLSYDVAKKSSDIDFLIITSPKRLYICRTLIILFLKFIRVYKTKLNRAGKFCLGFYLTENNLDIGKVAFKPTDPHYYYWFANITAVWGIRVYKKFINHNQWIKKHFANLDIKRKLKMNSSKTINVCKFYQFLQKIGELPFSGFVGNKIEDKMADIHIKHTWSLPENYSKNSTTIARSNILKLHAADRRTYYNKRISMLIQNVKIT